MFNEFNGLNGVFPVDVAIYYREQLVAFVEVDGEFHYKFDIEAQDQAVPKWMRENNPTLLRRKNTLKEFCYRKTYPHLPLYRIRSDQCETVGFPMAGEALAKWIISDLKEKRAKSS